VAAARATVTRADGHEVLEGDYITLDGSTGEVFLGRSITTHKNVSEATLQKVDGEIRRIIDTQYKLARKLLEDNRDKVETMARTLLEWETLDADQINDIMAGKPPRPPKTTPSAGAPTSAANDGGAQGAAAPAPSA